MTVETLQVETLKVEPHFDPQTWTMTYLVWDEATRDAVIIDPVLNYDPIGVRVSEESINTLMDELKRLNLTLRAVLETHAHADHLTGADRLRELTGAPVVIGAKITQIQSFFKGVLGLPESFPVDGRQFDHLLHDGETFQAGSIQAQAIDTPGHTPACISYRIGDMLFTGDALFMPDYGTGRCDFPSGSADLLWESVQKLYQLPDSTRVFVGHDYQPGGREIRWETTIGESKRRNIQLQGDTPKEKFVEFRTTRDKTLKLPNLIFQSIQVNIGAGKLPEKEANGLRYLKLPLNLFG